MKRLFGAYPLALFALYALLQISISSCANSSDAPTSNTVSYSASAFFDTEIVGDTSNIPFPFCFTADYLKEKLALTDSQAIAIQQIQDSLRAGLKIRFDAMKAAGTLTPDSARAIRLEFQTELYKDVAGILTADQLATLQNLRPPVGPREGHHGGDRRDPHGRGPRSDSLANLDPVVRDSIVLAKLETVLTDNLALTADQITAIQQLQAGLHADTTLDDYVRRVKFESGLETILTADQLAKLRALGDGDDRHHRRHR